VRWIVDGMNVIGSRPDGWWRDRAGAQRRLVAELAGFRARRGEPVEVVFDGRARPAAVVDGITVSYAAGGPNAADHVIAAMVRSLDQPADTTVVTSDAVLAGEVRATGAVVLGAGAFRRLLQEAGE
jgi:predicted RNA-binding protein with PIN domain